jgi:hypothetical protein
MSTWRVQERPNYPGDDELGDAVVFDPRFSWPQRFKSWTEAVCYAFSWMEPGDTLVKDPPDESEPQQ